MHYFHTPSQYSTHIGERDIPSPDLPSRRLGVGASTPTLSAYRPYHAPLLSNPASAPDQPDQTVELRCLWGYLLCTTTAVLHVQAEIRNYIFGRQR